MKINSKRQERNYIIIGLCLVLVIMGVGYAAFSQLLTINGTANISNSWCVGFDNTKESDYTAKAGITGGTTPTGSITFSGSTCETKYQPDASLTATFKQPGDQIEYTLTIKNKSTVPVAIKSIQVENNNVTTDTTIKKENIEFIVHMPESTNLAIDGETTMKVVARFQNTTDVTGPYNGEVKTLNVKINAEQGTGTDGMDTTFTGTIYRNDTAKILNTGDMVAATYCAYGDMGGNRVNSCDVFNFGFNTKNECTTFIANNQDLVEQYQLTNITCENAPQLLSTNYKTDPSALNANYYLKHDVVSNVITASYACFVYNNQEHCLKGGDGGAAFAANTQTIKDYQTFYNLPDNKIPGCNFRSSSTNCDGGGFDYVQADSDGNVLVKGSSSEYCYVSTVGDSYCNE